MAHQRKQRTVNLTAAALRLHPVGLGMVGVFVAFELAFLFKSCALTVLNSDHVQSVLEVTDILNGNFLLHGWILALQNYYLTDTPFFLLTRLLFGQTLVAIYAAPFLIYVILLLAAIGIVWFCIRDIRDRMIGMAALLFYLAVPDLNGIGPVIFVGTQHIGTLTFCLLAWVTLERIERAGTLRQARNFRVIYGISAFIAFFSDPLSVFIFLIPTLIGLSFALSVRSGRRTQAGLIGITIGVYICARVVLLIVQVLGGFTTIFPEPIRFVGESDLGHNAVGLLFGLLTLSGGNVFGHPLFNLVTLVALLKMAGLGIMLDAMVTTLRRGFSGVGGWDLRFVLALAMVIQLLSCLVSQDFAESLRSVAPLRFLVPTIVYGGVLTALELPTMMRGMRAMAPRLLAPRLLFIGLCGAGLVGATLSFFIDGALHWNDEPIMTRASDQVAGVWLLNHGLTHGVGTYWESALITALTGEKIAVRAVFAKDDQLRPYTWVAKPSWYNQRPQFVIYDRVNDFGITAQTVTATYGPPTAIEHVAGFDIAVLAPLAR